MWYIKSVEFSLRRNPYKNVLFFILMELNGSACSYKYGKNIVIE